MCPGVEKGLALTAEAASLAGRGWRIKICGCDNKAALTRTFRLKTPMLRMLSGLC